MASSKDDDRDDDGWENSHSPARVGSVLDPSLDPMVPNLSRLDSYLVRGGSAN
jgi:hypothetical protein